MKSEVVRIIHQIVPIHEYNSLDLYLLLLIFACSCFEVFRCLNTNSIAASCTFGFQKVIWDHRSVSKFSTSGILFMGPKKEHFRKDGYSLKGAIVPITRSLSSPRLGVAWFTHLPASYVCTSIVM